VSGLKRLLRELNDMILSGHMSVDYARSILLARVKALRERQARYSRESNKRKREDEKPE
jgi:hypothetical protein